MSKPEQQPSSKELSTPKAFILLILSIAVIAIGKIVFGGDIAVTLIIDAAIISTLAMIWGVHWSDIEEQMKENLRL